MTYKDGFQKTSSSKLLMGFKTINALTSQYNELLFQLKDDFQKELESVLKPIAPGIQIKDVIYYPKPHTLPSRFGFLRGESMLPHVSSLRILAWINPSVKQRSDPDLTPDQLEQVKDAFSMAGWGSVNIEYGAESSFQIVVWLP